MINNVVNECERQLRDFILCQVRLKKKKILLAKIWVEMVSTHMNNNLVLHRRGNETLNLFQKVQRNTGNAPQLFYTM